jgi:hypothetical protein
MSGRALAGIATLAALAIPGSAAAVYQPKVELSFDSYAPGQAPAVTSVMTQQLGEETTKTIAARFPAEFTLNPGFSVVGCTAEQEQASDCPESSRLGLATVETLYGHGEGVVYLTSDFRLFVPFRAYGPLYEQAITGKIYGLDNGMAEIVFDELPAVQVLEARIALDGGPRSVFITPRRCGEYAAGARFVSHSGTRVELAFPIDISGCAEALAISGARVAPRRVAAGRRPKLSWQLSRAAAFTEVALFRAERGAWRELASLRGPAAAGPNEMRLPRRWGRRLESPGRYRLRLRAQALDGVISKATVARFTVLR